VTFLPSSFLAERKQSLPVEKLDWVPKEERKTEYMNKKKWSQSVCK
jgi:hypothetical protein